MTKQEAMQKAKIPGQETGIEMRRSFCDICSPGPQCGLGVYTKDGEIIKVEGLDGYPGNDGKLCTKGACTRQYVYRKNRIQTPLRRKGERGSGEFEAISWDEAYREIADKLNKIKAQEGADAVAWYTGYSKWLRPWLHRMAYSFGTQNYGTESSCCYQAGNMAWKTVAGQLFRSDLANAKVYMGWGCNTMLSNHIAARNLALFKERGGKVIIIDPRITPTSRKVADLHLQLHPGSDGALALGMANVMIENDWVDRAYIEQHVHGYTELKEYVQQFDLEKTAKITGVAPELIVEATRMYATSGPATTYFPTAAINHHINGYNSMRALISLQALTGNIDRVGGDIPHNTTLCYVDAGFETLEKQFVEERRPTGCKSPIGAEKFPLWNALVPEFQAMDLARQIREGTPYPIHALMLFGCNHRMFPQPSLLLEAFEKVDFIVATDLVMTDTCRMADIVLPVCSSLERSELKAYPGGMLTCTKPVIKSLYDSKSDAEVLCELAIYLDMDDTLMKSGYEATQEHLIRDLSVTLEELREADLPLKMQEFVPAKVGNLLKNGFQTPTGKLELYSELIVDVRGDKKELDPLPVWYDSFGCSDASEYPFTLISGARLPHVIHTRLHDLPWARQMRKEAAVDIHPDDAKRIGVKKGDQLTLATSTGKVNVRVHITGTGLSGDVYMYHGYNEADVNELVPEAHFDPYSGFPGFRQLRCKLVKAGELL